jgi:hypothetical protein
MEKKSTRDAALSRLFGEPGESSEEELQNSESADEAPIDSRSVADTLLSGEDERAPVPGASKLDVGAVGAPVDLEGPSIATDPKEGALGATPAEGARSGYIGSGRYVRETGVLERITPYVRPDQAEALRVAVARKRDPRGKDISQIVQSLLDEAGYRGPVG